LGKAAGSSQAEDLEGVETMDFDVPQADIEMGQESQRGMKSFDEVMIEANSALTKEIEEMKKVEQKFEENIQRLSQMLGLPLGAKEGGAQPKMVIAEKHSTRVMDK
jgi:hypothetical protein